MVEITSLKYDEILVEKCNHAYRLKDKVDKKCRKFKRKITQLIDKYFIQERKFTGVESLLTKADHEKLLDTINRSSDLL
jgi:hypothetical protein